MNWWDENVGPLISRPDVAGMLGALLGSFVGTIPGVTKKQRALNTICGMVIAYYLGPSVAHMLGITNIGGATAIGFLTGMLGLAILLQISASLKTIDWRGRIERLLDRWTGSTKP